MIYEPITLAYLDKLMRAGFKWVRLDQSGEHILSRHKLVDSAHAAAVNDPVRHISSVDALARNLRLAGRLT